MHPLNNVIIPTAHGMMIINRHEANFAFGVSKALVDQGTYEPAEVGFFRAIVQALPPQCVVLDVGANIGVHTLDFARDCSPKGGIVHAFEAQRIVFQMLCGNVALNSLENVMAHHCAVGLDCGTLNMPRIDYGVPTSFGSVELGTGQQRESIGQALHWDALGEQVPLLSLDSLALPRADFIKIDVEGMELDVLNGADQLITQHKPVLYIEFIKTDASALKDWLVGHGYEIAQANRLNWVATHPENPCVRVNGLPLVA